MNLIYKNGIDQSSLAQKSGWKKNKKTNAIEVHNAYKRSPAEEPGLTDLHLFMLKTSFIFMDHAVG